jgi:hypothetical protein
MEEALFDSGVLKLSRVLTGAVGDKSSRLFSEEPDGTSRGGGLCAWLPAIGRTFRCLLTRR